MLRIHGTSSFVQDWIERGWRQLQSVEVEEEAGDFAVGVIQISLRCKSTIFLIHNLYQRYVLAFPLHAFADFSNYEVAVLYDSLLLLTILNFTRLLIN